MPKLVPMRLRLKEVMADKGLKTYGLHKLVEGEISRSSVYRMLERPREASLAASEVQALCEALDITPNDLYGYQVKRGGKG